jgi:hypothetical protein
MSYTEQLDSKRQPNQKEIYLFIDYKFLYMENPKAICAQTITTHTLTHTHAHTHTCTHTHDAIGNKIIHQNCRIKMQYTKTNKQFKKEVKRSISFTILKRTKYLVLELAKVKKIYTLKTTKCC